MSLKGVKFNPKDPEPPKVFKVGALATVVKLDQFGIYDEAPWEVVVGDVSEFFSTQELRIMMIPARFKDLMKRHRANLGEKPEVLNG